MGKKQSKERSYIWGYIVVIFLMILVFVIVISFLPRRLLASNYSRRPSASSSVGIMISPPGG
jgi:hypothetical protein